MKPKAKLLFASLALASGLVQAGDSYEEGRLAYERGDYAGAQAKLLVAARDGDAAAQEVLGFMYVLGPSLYPGISRDLTAASLWFERAARSGRPAARYMACAMARREHASRPGAVYCFDRIAETGEPPVRR
jgi:hypothetical protein